MPGFCKDACKATVLLQTVTVASNDSRTWEAAKLADGSCSFEGLRLHLAVAFAFEPANGRKDLAAEMLFLRPL